MGVIRQLYGAPGVYGLLFEGAALWGRDTNQVKAKLLLLCTNYELNSSHCPAAAVSPAWLVIFQLL